MIPWDKLDWGAVGSGLVFLLLLVFQSIRGRNDAQPRAGIPQTVEVAGDVVVVKKLDLLVEALGQNSFFLADHKKCLAALEKAVDSLRHQCERDSELKERYRVALDKNTQTAINVAGEASDLDRAMRDLVARMEALERAIGALRDEMLKDSVRPRGER